jgi:enamine deaminase RidA (YjgF/YER057c/UK114 family)
LLRISVATAGINTTEPDAAAAIGVVMEIRQVNPWTWQERSGFAHAWRVDGADSLVFLAGQGPISPDGELVAPGDFVAQTRQTFENMRTVLEQADASFASVVKMTVFLTDLSRLRDFAGVRNEFIDVARPPASTAVEVSALAVPGMMVEVEAIAVV